MLMARLLALDSKVMSVLRRVLMMKQKLERMTLLALSTGENCRAELA